MLHCRSVQPMLVSITRDGRPRVVAEIGMRHQRAQRPRSSASENHVGVERDRERSLKEEVLARTAAMENLQEQLFHVEALRQEELKTAIAKFEQLEESLDFAEKTLTGQEEEIKKLEKVVKERDSEIIELATEQDVLNKQLVSSQQYISELERKLKDLESRDNKEKSVTKDKLAEIEAALKESKEREVNLREACAQELQASNKVLDMAKSVALAVENSIREIGTSSGVSSEEVEVLLTELDMLKGELEAELQVNESTLSRALTAENELAQILELEKKPGCEEDIKKLGKDLALAEKKAMDLASEMAQLRIQNTSLLGEIAELQQQKDALEKFSEKTVRSDVQRYVRELEARNKEMASALSEKKAALQESRSFLANMFDNPDKTSDS